MGSWSTKPWDNDTAADWYGNLFDTVKLREEVVKTLSLEEDNSDSEEIRAAALILLLLGRYHIWPVNELEDDIALAISRLKSMKDYPYMAEYPEYLREIGYEVAVLEFKLDPGKELPDTEDFKEWWLSYLDIVPHSKVKMLTKSMSPMICDKLADDLPKLLEAQKTMQNFRSKVQNILSEEGICPPPVARREILDAFMKEIITTLTTEPTEGDSPSKPDGDVC